MRYQITKENIEFLAEPEEQPYLVKAIVEVLVPKVANKLYFYSTDSSVRASVAGVVKSGLVVMDESGVDTFHRYKRIHYHNGCTTLVPVLSGAIKKNEWVKLCDNISSMYHENA